MARALPTRSAGSHIRPPFWVLSTGTKMAPTAQPPGRRPSDAPRCLGEAAPRPTPRRPAAAMYIRPSGFDPCRGPDPPGARQSDARLPACPHTCASAAISFLCLLSAQAGTPHAVKFSLRSTDLKAFSENFLAVRRNRDAHLGCTGRPGERGQPHPGGGGVRVDLRTSTMGGKIGSPGNFGRSGGWGRVGPHTHHPQSSEILHMVFVCSNINIPLQPPP